MPSLLQRDRVLNSFDGVGGAAGAAAIQELNGHQLDLPRDPRYAGAVVTPSADGASDVSSMAVVVLRISGVGDEIKPVHIIDVAVPVIIDVVSGDFAWICPRVRGQIRMVVGDARVDHNRET